MYLEAAHRGPSSSVSAARVGELEGVPDCWPQPGPDLALLGIWGSETSREISSFLSLFAFQITEC